MLEQIIDFPELFDEYPQLRSIRIKPTPALALFVKGSYSPETKEISLASVPNTPKGRKDMMSTLLHEVQHAVQDIEGLYGGANTGMFEPAGFGERMRKNQDARRELETDIEDSLDNLVVTLDDPASKTPKTGLFSKIFGLSTPTSPPRTQKGLAGADQETDDGAAKVRAVKRVTVSYLKKRAEEEEQIAAGQVTEAEKERRELEDAIARRQQQLRDLGASEKEIADVETEYRGQSFRYGGSDREMIYLADTLKRANVNNSEKVAERIGEAFDDQIQKLRPILKEGKQIEEINSRSYEMYAGNPGEVEARNVQRRFEGIEEGEYLRAPSGELRPFPEKLTAEELQRTFPEDTQQMVLPEGGLVYSLAEGRKGQPSFSIDDPNDPQMELPGMGPPKPVPTEDPAANLLSMRDGMMGALQQDKLGSRKRSEIQASLNRINQRIFSLRQEAGYPTDNLYANGGMVNNMRRRNISGLTNLFSKYNTSGPLAGAGVPRGTMPVMMNQGGSPDFTDVPISVQRQVLSDLSRVPTMSPNTQGLPPVASEVPVAEQMPPAQTTTLLPTLTGGPTPITTDPLFSTAPALPAEAALPPSVYTPPAQTPVTVPTQPMFTTPLSVGATPDDPDRPLIRDMQFIDANGNEIDDRYEPGGEFYVQPDPYAVPAAPAPGMLSDAVVDFDISDQITPQTGGYATTRGMDIQATGDPFADAVEGEYQMALYRPTPSTDMPFLSLDFARPPTAPDQAPPPPQSDQYSTGSYGRLEFAEAVADYERRYGPVEDYTPPEPVMDDGENPETTTPGTTTPGGTTFYPEPPPVRPSGGPGPQMRYLAEKLAWEEKYGPVEDYYAAQSAAQQTAMNIYLGQQNEEIVAAQFGMTVEQLRDVNARRRKQGLPPLGGVDLPDIGDFYR